MNRSSYVIAFVCLGLLVCDAQANKTAEFFFEPGSVHHPADFYQAISEVDRNACQKILGSLNKEYEIIDENTKLLVNTEADSFLWSDLQVPWTRWLVRKVDPDYAREASPDGLDLLDIARVNFARLARSWALLNEPLEFRPKADIFIGGANRTIPDC